MTGAAHGERFKDARARHASESVWCSVTPGAIRVLTAKYVQPFSAFKACSRSTSSTADGSSGWMRTTANSGRVAATRLVRRGSH